MAYIVIIGIIIVIIMVITSTKIKSAAAAFESEIVEKDEFRIEKAEGFLYPIREKPDFPFEAYSKLYGERSTRNIWQARVRLRISDGFNLQKLVKEIKKSDEKFISQKNFDDVPEGQKGTIVRTEKTENEVDYKVLRKIVQSKKQGKTYELKTTILEPFGGEYTDKACKMMESLKLNN